MGNRHVSGSNPSELVPPSETRLTHLIGPGRRGLTARHLQFIAIGGAIGSGLFLGSAAGIKGAGPALLFAYALGGLMAGIAALLMTARLNAGHPTAGIGMEFDAIAAVAVGGTSFERGDGWLFGTLLGVLAIGVLRNGLNLLAIPSSVQVACVGLLVILALLLDRRQGARA